MSDPICRIGLGKTFCLSLVSTLPSASLRRLFDSISSFYSSHQVNVSAIHHLPETCLLQPSLLSLRLSLLLCLLIVLRSPTFSPLFLGSVLRFVVADFVLVDSQVRSIHCIYFRLVRCHFRTFDAHWLGSQSNIFFASRHIPQSSSTLVTQFIK